MWNDFISYRRSMIILACLLSIQVLTSTSKADDVGMVKARLFEDSLGVYVMEVDISAMQIGMIGFPILPERFKGSGKTEYEGEGTFLTVRYFFSCQEIPLNTKDVILLQWTKTAVSLTTQFLEKNYIQTLFTRGPQGIVIPINKLLPVEESFEELLVKQFLEGLNHPINTVSHIMLLVVLIMFVRRLNSVKVIYYLIFGQVLSMILVDIGISGIPIGVSESLYLLALIITLRYLLSKNFSANKLFLLFMLLGILHGIGFANAQIMLGFSHDEVLASLFTFHLGMDLIFIACYFLAVTILKKLLSSISREKNERILVHILGAASVLFFITTFISSIDNGIFYGLNQGSNQRVEQYSLPQGKAAQVGTGSKPTPVTVLQSPIETFLTIEPFEIRFEALLKVSDIDLWWSNSPQIDEVIAVEDQEKIMESIKDNIQNCFNVIIDGKSVSPALARADFVTISSTGIFTRTGAIPENRSEAVIGLNYIFNYNGMPKAVDATWSKFTNSLSEIAMTYSDPFGGKKMMLTEQQNQFNWKNKLRGYRIPKVEPVKVIASSIPVISVILFLSILMVLVVNWIKKKSVEDKTKNILVGLTVISFLIYPFIRFSVELPLINNWKPNEQEAIPLTDALLTNVYRSLDLRDEEGYTID